MIGVMFLVTSYELFLLVSPPQPNDPHHPVITSLSLQCYPRYSRWNDIPIAYSSSVAEAATSS